MTMIDSRFLKLKVIDDLSQGGANDALSAEQGKNLHQRIQAIENNKSNS